MVFKKKALHIGLYMLYTLRKNFWNIYKEL